MMFFKETNSMETSIGRNPKDWMVVNFGDYVELRHGYQFRSFDFVEKGIKVLKIEQLQANGDVDLTNCSYIADSRLEEFKDVLINKGDVLMALTGGTLGKVARIKTDIPPVLQNYRVGNFIVKDEARLSKSFFYHILTSAPFLQQVFSKVNQAAQPNIGKADFETFKFPLPDKDEQREISRILGSIDSALELADQVIVKTERLKKGLTQQLLTRGIGHTETKQTPIGKVPQDWELVQLKDVILSYKNGIYKPSQYAGKGLPCVRMYNIVAGRINLENAALLEVTEQELEEFGVKPGDIIVNRVNTSELVGKAGVVPEGFGKATFESKNIRIRVDTKKVLPDFLAVFVQTKAYSNQLLSRAKTAVAQATVTQEDLDSVVIPLPPKLAEQQKIAEITRTMDKKLLLEAQERERLQRVKQGLMDLLLTGKVRIKVD